MVGVYFLTLCILLHIDYKQSIKKNQKKRADFFEQRGKISVEPLLIVQQLWWLVFSFVYSLKPKVYIVYNTIKGLLIRNGEMHNK